jgi:signal transduction histidine kinase
MLCFLMSSTTITGNVAHDLRTPLQAFQSEIELLRETIKNDDNTPEKQKSQLDSIKQLGLICHFMNMTINRSIDFTKASSGIKLNPSIESVNFSDTMSWAVGCMMTTQEGTVPIVLEPVPPAIHNHIYTDKQWLMENMLCLLSNAQKFTTEGAITIRCTLHTKFEGSVVQRSNHGRTAIVSDVASSAAAKKYSVSDCNNSIDDDCSLRSPGELSSWREKVSDYVVDLEVGAASSLGVNPISTGAAPSVLMIEIEDSGIGITKENKEKLFQPFAQVRVHYVYCDQYGVVTRNHLHTLRL